MKKNLSAAALAASLAVLAIFSGCSSTGRAFVPDVRQETNADGSKAVRVVPARLACAHGSRCPLLGVEWSSAKAAQAVLSVSLPGQTDGVTGADFHLGGSETVRLRALPEPSASAESAASADSAPVARFDVPLRLVDRIAYAQRTWVRLHTADGRTVEEFIDSGEQRSQAAEAFAYFLVAVQAAGGAGQGLEGGRGGLFERLGVGGK